MRCLDWARNTRRNHALEHATIAVLLRSLGRTIRLAGIATPTGFYLYGNLSRKEVRSAADEALTRIQCGESHLALSPLCGTNLVLGGILISLGILLPIKISSQSQNLSGSIIFGLLGAVFMKPVGKFIQKHVTTNPNLNGVTITQVRNGTISKRPYFKIETIDL